MVKQLNDETNELQDVTPKYSFEQGDEGTFACLFVQTLEYIKENDGDTDDDISPVQFVELFDKIWWEHASDAYVLKSNPNFVFHDVSYGTWCISPLINGEYAYGELIDEEELHAALKAVGFEFDPESDFIFDNDDMFESVLPESGTLHLISVSGLGYMLVPDSTIEYIYSDNYNFDEPEEVPDDVRKFLGVSDDFTVRITPGSRDNDRVLTIMSYIPYVFDSVKDVMQFFKDNPEFEMSDEEHEFLNY